MTPDERADLAAIADKLLIGHFHRHVFLCLGPTCCASEAGDAAWDALTHLVLPGLALGTIPLAIVVRITRAAVIEVQSDDYVRTAEAKGLTSSVVRRRHILRNALLPVSTTIGLQLGLLPERFVLAREMPTGWTRRVVGTGIGGLSAMMGIGGGSFGGLTMTLCGRPIHQAVATSAGIVVPITLAGTLGYVLAGLPHQAQLPPLLIGFVSLIGFVLMAPVSSLAAPYGAKLAHTMSKRALEIAFGLFLMAASLRFLASLVC